MSILFHCTECERPLKVADKFADRRGSCPNCKTMILVPAKSEIAEINFRYLLERWTARQKTGKEATTVEAGETTTVVGSTIAQEKVGTATKQGSAKKTEQASSQIAVDQPTIQSTAMQPPTAATADTSSLATDSTKSNSVEAPAFPAGSGPTIKTDAEKVGAGLNQNLVETEADALQDGSKATWFIRPPSGGQFGPASATLLKQWIHEARVTGDSYVWCEGWDDWQLAAKVFPAIASKISVDSINQANADQVTAARTRTAYLKARKKRTIRNAIWLVVGTLIVVGLIAALLILIQNQNP